MVIATRKPLCNKRWSASPASQDLQLTQLRHPWVATKASCKSKKGWKSRGYRLVHFPGQNAPVVLMPRPGFYCGHCSAQRSHRAQTIA